MNQENKKVGRPMNEKIQREGRDKGLTEDLTRFTFIVPKETLSRLKSYAFIEGITIKKALTEIIEDYLDRYESENGTLPKAKDKE